MTKITKKLSPVLLLAVGTVFFLQACSDDDTQDILEVKNPNASIQNLSEKDFLSLKGKSLEELGIYDISDLEKKGWKKISTKLISRKTINPNYSRVSPTDGLAENTNRVITPQNLIELGITNDILNSTALKYVSDSTYYPKGISINRESFGEEISPNAESRGWYAYMNAGVPEVKEETSIAQPSPLILNSSVYNNMSSSNSNFNVSLSYNVSTTATYSVTASAGLTFGDKVVVTDQHQTSTVTTTKSPVVDVAVGETNTTIGSNETHVDVTLGASAGFQKSKTVNIATQASFSGMVPAKSRVKILAIQRKKLKKYKYTLPITFEGYIAAKYTTPVPRSTPQADGPYEKIVARPISSLDILTRHNYRQTGYIETVEEIECEFYQFAPESINNLPL